MRTYEVAILGCGVISRTYLADIKAFYKSLHIKACADVSIELAEKLAKEFDIEKAYTTEDLLNDDEIEIVINLTPPQFHVELNKKIIEAGKHLFSEKPFATDTEDAKEVIELAKKKGVRIGCAPDTFLASGLQSVRYYLDNGLIGKPFMVTANMTYFGVETWHPAPKAFYAKGGGPLFDMGPYYVSAIVTLFGPVKRLCAFSIKPYESRHIYTGPNAGTDIDCEVDTTFTAVLQLESDVVVNLNISYDIYKSNLPMFEIYADQGTLTYPDPNFGGGTPKVYRKEQLTDPIFQDTDGAKERKDKFYELPELFPRVKDYSRGIGVMDLAAAIERKSENRANAELILHVTEVLQRIGDSAANGQMYEMETTCVRPKPIIPGGYVDQV